MTRNLKIALVTGGAGFIGSHLVDLLLKKNYRVIVIDNLSGGRLDNLKQHKNNKKLTFKKININNISKDEKIFKNVSYVFHFAGIGDIVPSIENPSNYMATNVQGTVKVLEASRFSKVKKIDHLDYPAKPRWALDEKAIFLKGAGIKI